MTRAVLFDEQPQRVKEKTMNRIMAKTKEQILVRILGQRGIDAALAHCNDPIQEVWSPIYEQPRRALRSSAGTRVRFRKGAPHA
jgi:hypothetical protein